MLSKLLQRILVSSVDQWAELRQRCGLDVEAFLSDIQHPLRIEDYEDLLDNSLPTEEKPADPPDPKRQSSGILLQDNDRNLNSQTTGFLPSNPPTAPPLPPRSYVPFIESPVNASTLQSKSGTDQSNLSYMPPPPLPPRSTTTNTRPSSQNSEDMSIRRKPAPPLSTALPPRYSTVVNEVNDVSESPSTYATPADGFGPPRRGDWSFDHSEGAPSRSVSNGSAMPRGSIRRKPITPSGSKDDKSASALVEREP